ncbi:uncharacterized protein LOC128239219 isoform X1 [Mya arenaria]|uniref:uncharacterized protein LOC128239219 isoform X1 n=1 Tax=Mya arenaria TaxID=6604 RepID=UPI0022E048C4|nr:uncharacterized protein LOC128239219 isoform X1 [Mya arenaria]
MDKTEMQPESHAACSGENGNVVNGAQPNEAGMNSSSDHLVSRNLFVRLDSSTFHSESNASSSENDADVLVKALVTIFDREYSEAEIRLSINIYEKRRKMRYSRGHSEEIVEIMDEMREGQSQPSGV